MTTLIFWLKTASAASAVDLNPAKTTISFQNPNGVWPNVYWCSDGSNDATGLAGKWAPSSAGGACGTYSQENAATYPNTVTVNGITYQSLAESTILIWEVGTGMSITSGQKVRVTIDLSTLTETGTGAVTDAGFISPNAQFTVIVKPPIGSVLEITRSAPPEIGIVNDLG
jgi:archaellin